MQTRARGVTQTYSAYSFKDFTQKPLSYSVQGSAGRLEQEWGREDGGMGREEGVNDREEESRGRQVGGRGQGGREQEKPRGREEGESGGLGTRNTFDRRSQLRKSNRSRKKSSVIDSPASTPHKTGYSDTSDRRGEENVVTTPRTQASVVTTPRSQDSVVTTPRTQASVVTTPRTLTLSSASTPRTAGGIVQQEMDSEKFSHSVLNSSRTEYNSNYGNLI